jgi:succinate dehydrogenase/fumarate reductase flavoprotein subunit
MQHNELQQAETDTFMGRQRDLLDEHRANLQDFRTRYNSVRQTDQGLATLEEYVDCVHDGLVHYGGFVRFNELTLQQRSSGASRRA